MNQLLLALTMFLQGDLPELAILKGSDSNVIGRKFKLRSEKQFWLVNRQEAESIVAILQLANFKYDETRRIEARIYGQR